MPEVKCSTYIAESILGRVVDCSGGSNKYNESEEIGEEPDDDHLDNVLPSPLDAPLIKVGQFFL